jgi:thioredoxin-related protein
MKKYFLLFLLLPFIASAQEKGIQFEHRLSWQQVKEKAKKENKYLFVDCYTTWCAPCKQMASEVFTQEKVGNFFNRNFVNVKVQFDQTKSDSEEIKSWYADAKAINNEFKITAYPTFLIFSPQGELVHRIVGGGKADDFISWVQIALNPETQYYTLLKKNDSAATDPQRLKKLALAAEVANDEANSTRFVDAYMATQSDLFTRDNLDFVSRFIKKSESKGFQLLMSNREKVDAVLGKGKSNEILSSVIIKESINPAFENSSINIDSLVAATQAKYPTVDIAKRTDMVKVLFFQVNKNWDRFQPAIRAYMDKYGNELIPNALNYFARTVLENCKDPDCIAAAMAWSKRSVDNTQGKEPAYLDTYANLLYKLGKKQEAIAMQQKAVELVPGERKALYQGTLNKMVKGQ